MSLPSRLTSVTTPVHNRDFRRGRRARFGVWAGLAVAVVAGASAGAGEGRPLWTLSIDALPNFHFSGEPLLLPLAVYDRRNPLPPDPNPLAYKRPNPPELEPGGPRGEPVPLKLCLRWDFPENPADPAPSSVDAAAVPDGQAGDEIVIARFTAMPFGRERPVRLALDLRADELGAANAYFHGRMKTLVFQLRADPPEVPTPPPPPLASAVLRLWDLGCRPAGRESGASAAADFIKLMPLHFDRFGRMPEDVAVPERVLWLIPRQSEAKVRRWEPLRLINQSLHPRTAPAFSLSAPLDRGYLTGGAFPPLATLGGGYTPPSPVKATADATTAATTADGAGVDENDDDDDDDNDGYGWRFYPPVYGLLRQAVLWRLRQEGAGSAVAKAVPAAELTPGFTCGSCRPDVGTIPWADGILLLFPGGGDVRFGTPPVDFALALQAACAAFEYAPAPPRRLMLATPPPLAGYEISRRVYDAAVRDVARERFALACSLEPRAGQRSVGDGDEGAAVAENLAASLTAARRRWPGLLAMSPLLAILGASLAVTWLWRRARWGRVIAEATNAAKKIINQQAIKSP